MIACNTAHHWFDVLQAETRLPILHIADAVCYEISMMSSRPRMVAILATQGTLQSGFYQDRLSSMGLKHVVLSPSDSDATFARAVKLVKSGNGVAAASHAKEAVDLAASKGADLAILGCTELPIALANCCSPISLLDATDALAKQAVMWANTRLVDFNCVAYESAS